MLQRINSIKNLGRFKNCAAIGDVSLRRYTLIFAENACAAPSLLPGETIVRTGSSDAAIKRLTSSIVRNRGIVASRRYPTTNCFPLAMTVKGASEFASRAAAFVWRIPGAEAPFVRTGAMPPLVIRCSS
jgi:hypothetical protein